MTGRLVLVATPIGNLGDLSARAIETLREADLIVCEDTRRTRALLSAMEVGAAGRLSALHAHNEGARLEEIVSAVRSGSVVALVSDAGMPGISDPGQLLVAGVADAGLEVSVVPGPSAVLGALVVSGFSTDRFCMEGFLPRRGSARADALSRLTVEERSCVVFESPRRVAESLADLARTLGGARRVAVVRELTKMHEEVWRGSLEDACAEWSGREIKGEVVLVLEGARPAVAADVADAQIVERLNELLAAGMSRRDAAAAVSGELGVSRRRVYGLASSLA